MNTAVVISLAAAGVLGIAFAWAATKWRSEATKVTQVQEANKRLDGLAKTLQQVAQAKEKRIVKLEKSVAQHMSAGELVSELNGMFGKSESGGAPGKSGSTKPKT